MLVHSVFFWLKKDLEESQVAEFKRGLETLVDIQCAEAVYTGTPSTTERPVIDKSYDYALTVILKDMEAHDQYQAHNLHTTFLNTFKPMFEKVLIYDAD